MQRTEVRGGILLDGATFGNGLIIEYTRFRLADNQEVSLRSIQAPELRFMPERPEHGRIILANATVGRLVDKADSWPGPVSSNYRASPTRPSPLATPSR